MMRLQLIQALIDWTIAAAFGIALGAAIALFL
jgi:hypothetical protein